VLVRLRQELTLEKSLYQKKVGRSGLMKVGNQAIHSLELKTGRNEKFSCIRVRAESAALKGTDYCCSNGDDSPPTLFGC
jgi:hypothetical protein